MNKFLRSILFIGLLLLLEKPGQAHNFKFKQTISEACFSNSSHLEIACFNFEEVNGSACFVVSNLSAAAANASTNASLLCNNSYSFLSTTICFGDSSLFNAVFYHTTGVYTDTIPNY